MFQLLAIISIVIYTIYSDTCENTHGQSTFLSISINGQSVDKIGIYKYLDIIKTAASEIIPSSGTDRLVGLQVFGGETFPGAPIESVWTEQSLTQGDYSTISSLIDNLPPKYSFKDNLGNDVTNALEQTVNIEWIGQRYHILFSASNPTRNQQESLCRNAVKAKQNNIQTYVVLIGTQGINYIKEFYSCLVEDVANDIIEIDPNTPTIGIQKLFTRVCKPNGIDFKITEVNPIDDASSYRRFIEVYNRGANTSINVCFKNSKLCAYGSVGTGQYFVGYGGSIGIVPSEHLGVTVAAGLGASAGSEGWTAMAISDTKFIDKVIHTRTNGFQNQVINPGYRSYALRAVGFNNNYGLNWRMTCGNVGATPGSPPLNKCTQNATCASETCSATSKRIEQCDRNNDYCECSDGYFSDGDTCIDKPAVSNNNECYGHVVFDANSKRYWTYFVWNMPYDGIVWYTFEYNNITAVTDSQAVAIDYVIPTELVNVQITSSVMSPVGNQMSATITNVNCTTVNPTYYDDPGVYIGEYGICSSPRCNCYGEARDCCTPFGSQYGYTMTSSANIGNGCTNLIKSIEIQPRNLRNVLQERIYISKYGNTAETIIFYSIIALGQINQTDFENLTLLENELKRADRAVSGHHGYIYAAHENFSASRYGNRLNIEVLPIGSNLNYTDMVVIQDGSDEAFINIDISAASLKHACTTGQDGTTYEECSNTAMAFQLILLNCTSLGSNCSALYPTTLWISVKRSADMCDYLKDYYVCGNHGNNSNKIRTSWFFLFIFLFVFVYVIWRRQKRKEILARKQSEIIQQEDKEEGFVDEHAMLSPIKDGIHGVSEDNNIAELDINNYEMELEGTNDFAHVNAEVFQEEFQVRTIHHDSISLIAPSESIQNE